LAWSKAAESDRDYLAAFKAHKAELGAGERKGAPLCMQALCVVSPEWVKAAEHLDSQIERGTRRTITDRQHLTPETYGLVKDKARAEALQEHAQASDVVRALHSASSMAPEAIRARQRASTYLDTYILLVTPLSSF
jgi:hypothetical protein